MCDLIQRGAVLVFVPWAFGKDCLRLLKALTAVWLAAGPQQMQVLLPLSDSRKWESWILNLSIVGLSLLLPPSWAKWLPCPEEAR